MPISAIKSIKKIGETVHCCDKLLQAVELTFTDAKAVSYDDVFVTVASVHASVTTNLAHSFSAPSAPSGSSPPLVPQSHGTSSAAHPMTHGNCMVNAMLRGPSNRRAFRIWMDTWANICRSLYD